jgi:hypothetical protein
MVRRTGSPSRNKKAEEGSAILITFITICVTLISGLTSLIIKIISDLYKNHQAKKTTLNNMDNLPDIDRIYLVNEAKKIVEFSNNNI